MSIHQLLVSASPGDAITNSSFEIRSLLRRVGPSEIFAHHRHPQLMDEVLRMTDYEEVTSGDPRKLLIVHASIGEPEVHEFFVRNAAVPIVLVYHNISPAEYFRPHDRRYADLLETGRQELLWFRDKTIMALADSEFNAQDLREMGFRNVRVSPLILDLERLVHTEPDLELSDKLAKLDGPSILFVGQVLPHKRPDLLVSSYHILTSYLVPEANLFLVGSSRLPRYGRAVKAYIDELNLFGVHFPGAVSQEQLAAYYRAANAFITVSEHEGFCIPLLEAMAYDLPVMARDFAAIPSTLDGAGLLLPSDASPTLVAEAMAAVLNDQPLHKELVERGRRRLTSYDPEGARATFLENIYEAVA